VYCLQSGLVRGGPISGVRGLSDGRGIFETCGKTGRDVHRVKVTGLELGTDHRIFCHCSNWIAPQPVGSGKAWLAKASEMCYFGGLTAEEAAEATGRSEHSVRDDRRFAHARLLRALADESRRVIDQCPPAKPCPQPPPGPSPLMPLLCRRAPGPAAAGSDDENY
jgi:hypothetical protein